ncbi:glycosyltransferase family 4 protein [Algoriphagus halophilus]|uniref:Glycosyltransferase involved in cell wall bisynthesis n=1 Tax=Algoriphagus halophilus TaxID=226505 RepID=A0A1N6EE36_9BACT|nr:glycosyltransferase family 4 protein [Algoriphagus halophilus]SIN81312.1 Glycosyltransferase involved in cell wall bisynthesis [Algoriphagus halophilus]
MPQKRKVLFILPELLGPGGQELENIGFAKCLHTDARFKVTVLNFYAPFQVKELENLPKLDWDLSQLKQVVFNKKFLKIWVKSGFNFQMSLGNCFRNFPELFDAWLNAKLNTFDLCFTGISPTGLLPHILNSCIQNNLAFAYHESSIFHPKNDHFYRLMEGNGSLLISAKAKEEYLLEHYPHADYSIIKQWIYLGQEEFLKIPQGNQHPIKFGYVGRMDSGKNLQVILEAVKILKEKGHVLEFLLFGDGPEMANLKAFTQKFGLEDQVEFKGSFPFEQRHTCFSELDVFVMTSTFEGGPLVILEAMAAGKPIITTLVGDVPNRVFEDQNGYVLPIDCSPYSLSQQMEKYLDQQDLVTKHGKRSREFFLQEFEEKACQEIFKESIWDIIRSKSN